MVKIPLLAEDAISPKLAFLLAAGFGNIPQFAFLLLSLATGRDCPDGVRERADGVLYISGGVPGRIRWGSGPVFSGLGRIFCGYWRPILRLQDVYFEVQDVYFGVRGRIIWVK